MEEGRRLENLSWRIWNRETFCCDTQPGFAATPSMPDLRRLQLKDSMPSLSTSVESAASQDDEHRPSRSLPPDPTRVFGSKGSIESHSSGRGRERHITSLGLRKMVTSIKEQKKLRPLSPSISDALPTLSPPAAVVLPPAQAAAEPSSRRPSDSSDSSRGPMSSPESVPAAGKGAGSDTSADLMTPHHSVVRGFATGQISSSPRSQTGLAPSPVPVRPSLHPAKAEAAKRGMFFAGASSEEDSSFEDKMSARPPAHSSLTAGLKRSAGGTKQTSFRDEVESRTVGNRSHQDEDVFESDESDEDASESAIEDEEDSSDWEDSPTDSGRSSVNEKHLFSRVDSRANLASRRSLLTTLMHQPDRAAALAELAARSSRSSPALHRRSRASSPHGPSVAASPEAEPRPGADPRVPRSRPILMAASAAYPPALSPRTTRRNMLATELTESLRKHLLWERQQKNTTANAVLKRRHTAHDVAHLERYPPGEDTSKNNSWNHEYFDHGLGEYHQRGW
jgi:hypothetical protein